MIQSDPTLSSVVGPAAQRWASVLLDIAERALVVVLYGALLSRVVLAYLANGGAANLIVLASEGLVVFFILIRRRATDVSRRPADWLVALLATTTPLLVQPATRHTLLPPSLGAGMMLVGIVVQLTAKLTLGRSFGWAPAHRGLKLSGPYRLVRHPMYTGYLFCHVAFLLMNWTTWNAIAYAACYAAQVPRLLAEERLLRRDERYQKYMAAVRFRLLPGLF
jgi:protein-S-isoprenylcysteine O-methyltransferase Ste14